MGPCASPLVSSLVSLPTKFLVLVSVHATGDDICELDARGHSDDGLGLVDARLPRGRSHVLEESEGHPEVGPTFVFLYHSHHRRVRAALTAAAGIELKVVLARDHGLVNCGGLAAAVAAAAAVVFVGSLGTGTA